MTNDCAYYAGRQAFQVGRELSCNPWAYTDTNESRDMHMMWWDGWLDAQRDYLAKYTKD